LDERQERRLLVGGRFLIGDAPDVVVYETIDRPG
jgi:hypothetical protein